MRTFDDVRDRLATPLAEVTATGHTKVKLSPDPLDDETVLACLRVAHQATAGAVRRCEFLVTRDPEVKHQLARIYRQGWSIYKRVLRDRDARRREARQWEADHFEDVPVLVVACVRGVRPVFPAFTTARYYASAFRAVQNLLLGAHALGLGASVTTLPVWAGWEARRTLGLPWTVTPVAVVPLGWPKEELPDEADPVPLGAVVHLDRWGRRTWAGRQ